MDSFKLLWKIYKSIKMKSNLIKVLVMRNNEQRYGIGDFCFLPFAKHYKCIY